MRHLLITGAEQGLGKAIANHYWWDTVDNIRGDDLRGATKADIAAMIPHKNYTHVVNNFGINHLSWIGDTPQYDEDILHLNVMVPYWIIDLLVARGDVCQVINVSSQTYKVAQRCTSLYCASKAALTHMTRVMARELAPRGWVINSIAPGKIEDTDMSQLTDKQVLELRGWAKEDADAYALKMIPMGRFTSTSEVADAVVGIFKLPDYINGHCFDMTGGV